MTKAQQPVHDALFKQFLTHPENAGIFLGAFADNILPLCDLSTPRLEPASFVERRLRQLHSDVLYSVQMTEGEEYIYCLIEHQSKPDRLMGFRLMRIVAMSAIAHHLKKSPADKTLPLVVPFLFIRAVFVISVQHELAGRVRRSGAGSAAVYPVVSVSGF